MRGHQILPEHTGGRRQFLVVRFQLFGAAQVGRYGRKGGAFGGVQRVPRVDRHPELDE
jgi:hypothetical protein